MTYSLLPLIVYRAIILCITLGTSQPTNILTILFIVQHLLIVFFNLQKFISSPILLFDYFPILLYMILFNISTFSFDLLLSSISSYYSSSISPLTTTSSATTITATTTAPTFFSPTLRTSARHRCINLIIKVVVGI